jgi:hypothetical protein
MKLVTYNGNTLQMISDQQIIPKITRSTNALPREFAIQGRQLLFSGEIKTNPDDWDDGEELVYTFYGTESLDSLPVWQVPTNPVDDPAVEDNSPSGLIQSDANTTRLLQRHPDVYLQGALFHAHLYLKDDGGASKWGSLFRNGLEELRLETSYGMVSGSSSQVTNPYGD